MLEMQQLVDEQKKEPQDQGKPGKADLEDEEDNVADFMEVKRPSAATECGTGSHCGPTKGSKRNKIVLA